jgi:hypothetical protein
MECESGEVSEAKCKCEWAAGWQQLLIQKGRTSLDLNLKGHSSSDVP